MNPPQFRLTQILDTLTGGTQRQTLEHFLASEKGGFYRRLLADLADKWDTTPKTYETERQGRKAIVHWHWFLNGADWWITEKDADPDGNGQIQAYGFADLGQGPEWGYISMPDILGCGAELDLFWTPVTAAEVLGRSIA